MQLDGFINHNNFLGIINCAEFFIKIKAQHSYGVITVVWNMFELEQDNFVIG